MARVFIALQTPTVEMKITSKPDCAGNVESLFAEYNRYDAEEGNQHVQAFETILFNKEIPPETRDTNLKEYLKGEIVALREVPIFVEQADKTLVKQVIADTRTVQDNEALWGAASNCLAFLLDMLLDSAPWGASLTRGFYAVSNNISLGEEAEAKN